MGNWRATGAVAVALGSLSGLLSSCSDVTSADSSATSAGTATAAESSETPPARSGDLGREDLPAPRDLGRGWQYRIDMGNAEDGYVGSGEPAIAREPDSVLAAITPLGCRGGTYPMPTRALEVTYRRNATPAVGLILQFDDDAQAQSFFDQHASIISKCVTSSRAEVDVIQSSDTTFVSTRAEELGETPHWAEGMSIDSSEVILVAVADSSRAGIRTVRAALS